MSEYLTTREVADLLRIKTRKVYDMAAKGEIPCSRTMGKLLFPRRQVEAWIAGGMTGDAGGASDAEGPPGDQAGVPSGIPAPGPVRPNVFLGSHDPLLDWALRESRCGIATFFDGSADGLSRFERGEGVATGLHIFDATAPKGEDSWNVSAVRVRFGRAPVALVEFARRQRGFIAKADRIDGFTGGADLRGRLIVPRQPGAGSQTLLDHLLDEAGLKENDYVLAPPALTETDAAETIAQDLGEVTLGLKPAADRLGLGFQPLMEERFDLLVDRRAWFEEPMQTFLRFCKSNAFAAKAERMGGYDLSNLGEVRFNGAG